MNTYDPNDVNSSPYEPIMTDIVVYQKSKGEQYPAIVTKTYKGDYCDLTVFTSFGLRYATRVRFCSDVTVDNRYHWAPQKKNRKSVEVKSAKELAN